MTPRQQIKRIRPPMPPLAVRVEVAERQFGANTNVPEWAWDVYAKKIQGDSLTGRLKFLLPCLFDDRPRALDHDPALILRKYNPRIKDIAARYTPHAHDPAALVYREKSDHQQKTTGRKPGAERTITTVGSDAHLAAKFRRIEGKNKPKRKAKINSRGFGPQKRGFGK